MKKVVILTMTHVECVTGSDFRIVHWQERTFRTWAWPKTLETHICRNVAIGNGRYVVRWPRSDSGYFDQHDAMQTVYKWKAQRGA